VAQGPTGNVDYIDKFAWSENSEWLNFRPEYGGVSVLDDHLQGYAWSSGIGWVKLGSDGGGPYANSPATDWGINRDMNGLLSGYAWSENAGWINFSTAYSDVTIDEFNGRFDGYAWSSGVGWVHFQNPQPAYNVRVAFLSLAMIPTSSIAQGWNPQIFDAVIEHGFPNFELRWTAPGYSFALNENPIAVDPIPAPGNSIDLTATVTDQLSRATTSETVHLLVASDAIYFDYALPSECNTLEDLWVLLQDWRYEFPANDDPNADGIFDVRDTLYINVEDEGTPCDDP